MKGALICQPWPTELASTAVLRHSGAGGMVCFTTSIVIASKLACYLKLSDSPVTYPHTPS